MRPVKSSQGLGPKERGAGVVAHVVICVSTARRGCRHRRYQLKQKLPSGPKYASSQKAKMEGFSNLM